MKLPPHHHPDLRCAVAGAELADILAVRHAGDGAGPGGGGPGEGGAPLHRAVLGCAGAGAEQGAARLPVQQPRQSAGAQRPHVVSSALYWDCTALYCGRGTFRMEREDGTAFDCRIPPFSLESKQVELSSAAQHTGNCTVQEDPNDPHILGN